MKNKSAIISALLFVFVLTACGKPPESDASLDTEISEESISSAENEESKEIPLDKIELKHDMLPLFEPVSAVADIPSNSQNPWRAELQLDTMPVMTKGDKLLSTLDATQKANEIALKLGLALGSANISPDTNGEFWVGLSCSEGLQNVSVSVNELGETFIIYLRDGKAIPNAHKDNKLAWLTATYAPLFFDGEAVVGNDGDFGFVYEKGKDHKEDIVNYYFNTINFIEDGKLDESTMQITPTGTLQTVTANNTDCYTATEYPIISADAARERLAKGLCYRATVETDNTSVNRENVVSVTLMYGMNSVTDTFIPFYCFWVEGEMDGGACYVPFAVPAIAEEYLDATGVRFVAETDANS